MLAVTLPSPSTVPVLRRDRQTGGAAELPAPRGKAPEPPGTVQSACIRTLQARCGFGGATYGVAETLQKKHVFDPENNPRCVKPPERSRLAPAHL
jgi:hypothetical protein